MLRKLIWKNLAAGTFTKAGIRPVRFLWVTSKPPFPTNTYNLKSRHSRESGHLGRRVGETFFPISFRADEAGFPPARE